MALREIPENDTPTPNCFLFYNLTAVKIVLTLISFFVCTSSINLAIYRENKYFRCLGDNFPYNVTAVKYIYVV